MGLGLSRVHKQPVGVRLGLGFRFGFGLGLELRLGSTCSRSGALRDCIRSDGPTWLGLELGLGLGLGEG